MTQIDLIKKYHLTVRGNLGQHILMDPNIARKIVDLLDLQEGDQVLEIGPGLGALTWGILEYPIHYRAVEKDPRFLEILKREAVAPENTLRAQSVQWIHSDILKFDLASFFKQAGGTFKVISNLPYYITAPILFCLMDSRQWISRCVLMMQREVANRLHAFPGTKDYGRLSLALQYAAEVEKAFDVSAGCFTPRPKVDSSVVTFQFKSQRPLSCEQEEKELFRLIQTAFSQRRKTLANLLVQAGLVASRAEAFAMLERSGLAPDIRGEKLSLKDFLVLSENLRKPL